MNLQYVNQALSVIALLIGIGNALWVWLSRPARDTNKRIDQTEDDLKALGKEVNDRADRHREELKVHDRRIQRVEDELRHLATKEDIHSVQRQLTTVDTKVSGLSATVTRIDDFLRKHQ